MMGATDTGGVLHPAELSQGGRRPDPRIGGLVILGPRAEPLTRVDRLLSRSLVRPVAVTVDRMASWITANDEIIELTRLTSHIIRNGFTAVVYLDSPGEGDRPHAPEVRDFVSARLGQVMIGLADTPSFVVLDNERIARALVGENLGHSAAETLATTPDGFLVWELPRRAIFPGVSVAVCAGASSIDTVIEMVEWFEARRNE